VPRWFTEGLAVHEETAASPEWGDRLDPQVIDAIRNKRLLPVAELDRGFIRPKYPAQVVVSYFQAGRICDYIKERWGYQKLLDMMHAFAERKSTPEVISEQLGMTAEALDAEFLAWLEAQTRQPVENFDEWRKKLRTVAEHAKARRFEEVIREGTPIRDLYPDYVEAGNVYEFLAEAYLEKADKAAATAELELYAKAGGRSPATLKKLAGLQQEAGRKKEAADTLNRINYIYPVFDEELHRELGELWLASGNVEGAIREFRAALASGSVDTAGSHYNLARAYRQARRDREALEQVLLALEAAPSYRPAQRMLLELTPQ
jgi:tetratricopeptide (TPR) repeat protein